jgi:HAD superfamily hydrolase (TIGR01484 family)
MARRVRLVAFDLDDTAVRDGIIPAPVLMRMADFARTGGILTTASGRQYKAQEQMLVESGVRREAGFPHFMICADKFIYRLEREGYVELLDWNEAIRERWRRILPEVIKRLPQALRALDERKLAHATLPSETWDSHAFVALQFESVAAASAAMPVMDTVFSDLDGAAINRAANFSAVTVSNAGKGESLQRIATELRLAPSEILAVGDSYNDISMLDGRFGFQSAAVGNAEEVIQCAVRNNGGYIARKAGPDGFAEIMEILLDEQEGK